MMLLKEKTGATNSSAFQQLPADIKKSVLIELKGKRASLRLLERLTGISKHVMKQEPVPVVPRCACGYFSEYDIDTLDEIIPIVSVKYQTLAYFGVEKEALKDFVLRNRPVGLDRIVPFGETTAFALKWDGYNLIDTFSRIPCIL